MRNVEGLATTVAADLSPSRTADGVREEHFMSCYHGSLAEARVACSRLRTLFYILRGRRLVKTANGRNGKY